MERMFETVKAFNTMAGFREWLESKGISQDKSLLISERIKEGEIILLGKESRLRYEVEANVGLYFLERKRNN